MSNNHDSDDAPASPPASPSITTTTTTTVVTSPGSADRAKGDGPPASPPESPAAAPMALRERRASLKACVIRSPGEEPVCGDLVQLGEVHVGTGTKDGPSEKTPGTKQR